MAWLVEAILPHRVFDAVRCVSPSWMGRPEFAAVTVGVLSMVSWFGLELSWRLSSLGVGVRPPLYRRK